MACEHLQDKTCLILQELGIGSDNYQVACNNICKGEPDNLRAYFGNNKTSRADQAKRQAEAEAERQRLLAEMPGGFELATNLLRHLRQIAAHYTKTSRIYRPQADVERIVEICRACEKSTVDKNNSLRCVKCGCHIEDVAGLNKLGKANYDALHCDLDKW